MSKLILSRALLDNPFVSRAVRWLSAGLLNPVVANFIHKMEFIAPLNNVLSYSVDLVSSVEFTGELNIQISKQVNLYVENL
jgi:hypothetical protein